MQSHLLRKRLMSQSPMPIPQGDEDPLEESVDQALAACGGDVRATIKALILANQYLESEVAELMKSVSHAYARGRFHPYNG